METLLKFFAGMGLISDAYALARNYEKPLRPGRLQDARNLATDNLRLGRDLRRAIKACHVESAHGNTAPVE